MRLISRATVCSFILISLCLLTGWTNITPIDSAEPTGTYATCANNCGNDVVACRSKCAEKDQLCNEKCMATYSSCLQTCRENNK